MVNQGAKELTDLVMQPVDSIVGSTNNRQPRRAQRNCIPQQETYEYQTLIPSSATGSIGASPLPSNPPRGLHVEDCRRECPGVLLC
jgi:hypothetical protein